MLGKCNLRKKIKEFTQFIRTKLNLSSPLNMVEVVKTRKANRGTSTVFHCS